MNKSSTAICLALLVTPLSSFAGGDAAAGREKSAPCHACHGESGQGVSPMYPTLAGQYETYLEKTLADYRDGKRFNPLMSGFAGALSDQDIADLAAWYASLDGLRNLSE